MVVIPSGAYDSETLRVVVENALNGAGKTITGNYNVQRSSSAGTVNTASVGAAFRYFTITISGGGFCYFPADPWLRKEIPTWDSYGGVVYDPHNLKSTNELFQFPRAEYSSNHTSSFIDLRSTHTLFVHSPSFGNYSCALPQEASERRSQRSPATLLTEVCCTTSTAGQATTTSTSDPPH